tara:strand:+ start:185 stop:1552 length:1368 start_codon:yes stop_codon:yes gene_type:complete
MLHSNIFSNSIFVSILGFLLIAFLLVFGKRLNFAIQLERFGLPIAVLCGLFGILIGPYGIFNILSKETTEIWEGLLTPLLSIVFATLMLGRAIPDLKGLIKPITNQFLLALALGFGQFFVGGLVVKFFLSDLKNVNPLMGCLIEVGFEGGHGAAAIIGNSFNKLGFPEGLDLGLAMATMGLLSSSMIGSIFILLGKVLNITNHLDKPKYRNNNDFKYKFNILEDLKILLINGGLAGLAILIGILLIKIIRLTSSYFGDFSKEVIYSLPVFPLILIGSLLIRYFLEKTNKTAFISQILQREMGILSTDLLIFSAMASLNLSTVMSNLTPILLLTVFGLIWNILCIAYFAYYIFDDYWFEKGLAEFGNSTGVVASGLLLLRLADPNNISKTLPIFTSKQLFAQLLLSGGFFTVLSPFLLSKVGLTYWTEICGVLSILIIIIAFLLNNKLAVLFKSQK